MKMSGILWKKTERQHRGRRQFLVKWVGYDEPIWESEANVLDESVQPSAKKVFSLQGRSVIIERFRQTLSSDFTN